MMQTDQERRFGGLKRLYGDNGSVHISNAHVVVIGVGGVGSWAAEALVRSGVGELTLVDFDQISPSNVNRQIHALDSTIGQAKVIALQERFKQINAQCKVNAIEEFVELDHTTDTCNWPSIRSSFTSSPHAIIDACDQVKVKAWLAAWAIRQDASFITVGAAGGKELAHLVDVCDLADVTHDPLLAQMRYRLRKQYQFPRKNRMKVRCVFSRESVKQPVVESNGAACDLEAFDNTNDANGMDGSLNCHGYGSVVAVTATFGMVAAGQVLHDLAHAKVLSRTT